MKKINLYIAIFSLALLASCTHNDGDIGPLFGTWHVDAIEVDGTPDATYDGSLFVMFQSNIADWRIVDEQAHTYVNAWASWQQDGGIITFHFDDDWFPPHAITGFAPATPQPATVERLTSKDLILVATSSIDGHTRRFICTKQH